MLSNVGYHSKLWLTRRIKKKMWNCMIYNKCGKISIKPFVQPIKDFPLRQNAYGMLYY